MAAELTLEFLQDVKKADYVKAFKNKATWKKATAVIFMIDYKIEGKKNVVAIPYKKEADMKAKMKEIKKDKKHLMKKTAGGMISLINEGPEGLKAKVELKLGGMKPELLQEKGGVLFGKIKVMLEVVVAKDAELEPEENENENNSITKPSSKEKPTTDIKLILAKIAKLNKEINLKDGLQESDLKVAADLQVAIREFAAALKNSDASVRAEYGETFLKTKKIYAKFEEEIAKFDISEDFTELPEPWKTYAKNLKEVVSLKKEYYKLKKELDSLGKENQQKRFDLKKQMETIRSKVAKKISIYKEACDKINDLIFNTTITNCSNEAQKTAKTIFETDPIYKYITGPHLCHELEDFYKELFPRA